MMFGRNGIFGIGSSWKKVLKQESSKTKVVLTKVTVLKNGSECEDISSHPTPAKTRNPEDYPRSQTNGGTELAKSSDQNLFTELTDRKGSSSCAVLKLYKSESEDSGAEFPSGAYSPLTPSGSEQSLVMHRRVSSCDSGMALSISSTSPAIQHLPLAGPCPNSAMCIKEDQEIDEQQRSVVNDQRQPTTSAGCRKDSRSSIYFSQSPPTVDEGVKQSRHVSLVEILIADTNSLPVSKGGMEHAEVAQFDHESLKRGQSNDSLDKYMEKCCRLSEANQDKTADRGSGLGYLEHICQLIETIGQLQEQNKQLQKQLWVVERSLKVNRVTEEFFLNHCSCGAIGIYQTLTSLPDLQNDSSNAFTSQGGSLVLESPSQMPRSPGGDTDSGGRGWFRKPMCKEMGRSIETEVKHSLDGTRTLYSSHQGLQEVKAQSDGKVKALIRNSSLRKQDKAQEVSGFIKRSYTQLCRQEHSTKKWQIQNESSTD
ncbi:uncharacterized protein si:ch211-250c4.3 [Pristis pectinata]|uniref:uncharacterized protein si:ch211-250c4.3 n=1 Tax=Pristis pectinata TaxID=685728 RepID=UPI00223D965B|nr:uncharacterized protein si:ch211-250c4.3 [Pristis pectinata]